MAGFLLVSVPGGSLLLLFGEVGDGGGKRQRRVVAFVFPSLFNGVVRCVAVNGRFPLNFVTKPE